MQIAQEELVVRKVNDVANLIKSENMYKHIQIQVIDNFSLGSESQTKLDKMLATDWNLYQLTLYNLITNSIQKGGRIRLDSITIKLSYKNTEKQSSFETLIIDNQKIISQRELKMVNYQFEKE